MLRFKDARSAWFTFGSLATLASVLVVARVRAEGAPAGAGALTYSGRLEDAAGEPLEGPRNVALAVYDSASAGARVCELQPTEVGLEHGRFDLALPADCAGAVAQSPNLWVEVQVDGASLGRAKLGAVPYALEAQHAVSASTADVARTLADGPIDGALTSFTIPGATLAAPCVLTAGQIVDCTCPAGSFVHAAGADAGAATGAHVRESRALNATTWRLTCAAGTADVRCRTYHLMCSRVGP